MAKVINMEAMRASLRMLNKRAEQANEKAGNAGKADSKMEKLNALLQDGSFCSQLVRAGDAREAVALFAEKGIRMTVMEVNAFGYGIAAISKKIIDNGGELSEAELGNIAGGMNDGFSNSAAAEADDGLLMVGTVVGFVVNCFNDDASDDKEAGNWLKNLC